VSVWGKIRAAVQEIFKDLKLCAASERVDWKLLTADQIKLQCDSERRSIPVRPQGSSGHETVDEIVDTGARAYRRSGGVRQSGQGTELSLVRAL
jgi:hypothetical protein